MGPPIHVAMYKGGTGIPFGGSFKPSLLAVDSDQAHMLKLNLVSAF